MDKNALEAVKKDNLAKLKELLNNGIDVNAKDTNQHTLLHHAVNKSKAEIVKFLIENDCDVLLATDKNNTPLHIAVAKNDEAMVSVLLESTNREKLRRLLDAKTSGNGSAAIHVAASKGHYEIAKLLLSFGANFEIANKEGKKPVELIEDCEQLSDLLKLIDKSFERAKSADLQIVCELEKCDMTEFASVSNCRDNSEHTIVQVSVISGSYKLSEMLVKLRANQPTKFFPMFEENRKKEVDALADLAKVFHVFWYQSWNTMDLYVEHMRNKEYNSMADQMLEQGSYVLNKAHDLIQAYRSFEAGRSLVSDPNIRTADEVLEALGFDSEHLSAEYRPTEHGEAAEFFVSRGQGARYYELLHGKSKKGVRSFIDLTNAAIDNPINLFLESIHTVRLFEAVKNNDVDAAKFLLFSNANSNANDICLRTPLSFAAETGNEELVLLLLKYDAEPNVESKITPLHIAADFCHPNIVDLLLQYVEQKELANFIDRQTYQQKMTALHCAAKKASLDSVKILLKYGATYCLLNHVGLTPLDVSTSDEVSEFLRFVDMCFRDAKEGKFDFIEKLKNLQDDEILAVASARDDNGKILLHVTAATGANSVTSDILTLVKKAKKEKKFVANILSVGTI